MFELEAYLVDLFRTEADPDALLMALQSDGETNDESQSQIEQSVSVDMVVDELIDVTIEDAGNMSFGG